METARLKTRLGSAPRRSMYESRSLTKGGFFHSEHASLGAWILSIVNLDVAYMSQSNSKEKLLKMGIAFFIPQAPS